MSNAKIIKTKGIVLSEVNFAEADKMLTILTPDRGKISCVAHGARKNKSRVLASAQLLAFSDFILYKGQGETYSINNAELIESFYAIRNDFERLNTAMKCSKFLKDNIEENQSTFNIMKLFLNTIYVLSEEKKDSDFVENVFILKIMCMFGYSPGFFSCGKCGNKEKLNKFSIKDSSLKCDECTEKTDITLSDGAVATMRYIIKSDIKKIFSFEISESVLKEISFFRKIYLDSKPEIIKV